jgi:DNA repair photolyase
VPVGVGVAPQIPFINDDMEQVLEAAAQAGARCAFFVVKIDEDNWTTTAGSGDVDTMRRAAAAILLAIEDAQAQHGDARLSARCAKARRVLGVAGKVGIGGSQVSREGDGT